MADHQFTDMVAEARNVRDALAGHVAHHTVAVVPEAGSDLGTGVLVSSAGVLYVATARHVAEDLQLDRVFLIPRGAGPLRIVPGREIPRGMHEDRHADRFQVAVGDRLMSAEDADVALLRMGGCPQELQSTDFYPLERANSTPPRHRQVFVYGYAWELTQVHRPTGRGRVFPRIALGELRERGPLPYDPGRDLLVNYDAGEMNPKGMSGGGIWIPPSLGQGLFDPSETVLGGIQVAYFKDYPGKPLLATRIERLKALVP